jgi:hypothetical protein
VLFEKWVSKILRNTLPPTYADNGYSIFFQNYGIQVQADLKLTRASHKDAEQNTIGASITLDGVTLTDSLIR